jgi:NAD(P)H-dependent flavin oxidoreductase YrpB (nitropropane dioxygenase family)
MINTPFPRLRIRGFQLLLIIQGGMGIGIFGHRLAETVARHGAVGTLASVDLRRLYPDIMNRLRRCRDAASQTSPGYLRESGRYFRNWVAHAISGGIAMSPDR